MRMAELKLEVVRFASEDVIATSAGPLTGLTSGLFYIPAGQYAGYTGSASYVQFSGDFGEQSGGNYEIINIRGVSGDDDDDRAGLMSGGSYTFPGVGVTVDMSHLAPIAQQAYDAFSYGNGKYYTNGVSYYNQYWQ